MRSFTKKPYYINVKTVIQSIFLLIIIGMFAGNAYSGNYREFIQMINSERAEVNLLPLSPDKDAEDINNQILNKECNKGVQISCKYVQRIDNPPPAQRQNTYEDRHDRGYPDNNYAPPQNYPNNNDRGNTNDRTYDQNPGALEYSRRESICYKKYHTRPENDYDSAIVNQRKLRQCLEDIRDM